MIYNNFDDNIKYILLYCKLKDKKNLILYFRKKKNII
jgi:hypothetical protein